MFRKALDAYFTQTNFRYHFFPKYHTYHPHQKHVHQPSHESGSTLRLEVVSFSRLDGHKPCLSTSQKFLIDFEGMIHQEESFNKQIHMTPSWWRVGIFTLLFVTILVAFWESWWDSVCLHSFCNWEVICFVESVSTLPSLKVMMIATKTST